jgi:hypothetical protein
MTTTTITPGRQPKRRRKLTIADLTAHEFEQLGLCLHEGAHSVMGVIYGGYLRGARVDLNTLDGAATFDGLDPARHPVVAYAGPWAAARWAVGGRRQPSQAEIWRVLERGGCKDYKAMVASGATSADIDPAALALLDRCWPPIVEVAQQLHRSGNAVHGDACRALGIPRTGNSHHLSLIRSGYKPGSFTVSGPGQHGSSEGA